MTEKHGCPIYCYSFVGLLNYQSVFVTTKLLYTTFNDRTKIKFFSNYRCAFFFFSKRRHCRLHDKHFLYSSSTVSQNHTKYLIYIPICWIVSVHIYTVRKVTLLCLFNQKTAWKYLSSSTQRITKSILYFNNKIYVNVIFNNCKCCFNRLYYENSN